MFVKEIMNTDHCSVSPETSIRSAVELLTAHCLSGVPVVDENEHVIGFLSEADILHQLKTVYKRLNMVFPSSHALGIAFKKTTALREVHEAFSEIRGRRVEEFMTSSAVVVSPTDLVEAVAPMMVKRGVKLLPVVEEERLVGLLTRGDVLRALISDEAIGTVEDDG